jgi:DNA-binding beta-propeller fold protein YncE
MRISTLLAVVVLTGLIDGAAADVVVSHERSGDLLWMNRDGQTTARQPICNRPRGMAVDHERNRLFLACSDDDLIIELALDTRQVTRQMKHIPGPMALALFADGQRLVVSNEGVAQATVIDLVTGTAVATVETGFEPDGVAISESTGHFFVASETNGLVSVFDTTGYDRVAVIPTHLRPRRLALDEARGELWVSSEMGSRVEIFDLQSFDKEADIVFQPRGFRSEQLTPVDILLASDGQHAYVALGSAGHVAAVDRNTREILDYIRVGRRAWGLAQSADGQVLYVLNGLSDDMTLIDLTQNRPIRSVRTGLVPHAVKVIP